MEEILKFPNSQISKKEIVMDFNQRLLNNLYLLPLMLDLHGNSTLEEFYHHGHAENN